IQDSSGGWTVNGILSLGAGVTLQMAGGSAIYVHGASNGRSGGSLYAGGTADHPVTIASSRSTPAAGDWYGIAFWPGSSGTLDHIHLSDAGRGGMGLVGSNTCCYITAILLDGASPTISNSVIDHSAGNYVEVIHGSLPVLHDNHFTLPASGYGVTKKAGLLRRRSLTPPSMTGTLPVAHLV
ncbi:MAG: hypothetical protein ACR2PL_19955, partial [Dehalococcoidia bacterium]